MKIPHDPVALEEHFRDDDEGPVSNQGYMPYLNRFILDKVSAFVVVQICWGLKFASVQWVTNNFETKTFGFPTIKPFA